ncbi:MAG: hypothetical protein Q7W51_05740 [Coriobacteriia bacterium]|nr:hypothetical protein [Coriobacteriia bacterium]
MGTLWQDRRALRTVRNSVVWIASVVTPLPLVRTIPTETLGIAVAGAVAALLFVYISLYAVTVRY